MLNHESIRSTRLYSPLHRCVVHNPDPGIEIEIEWRSAVLDIVHDPVFDVGDVDIGKRAIGRRVFEGALRQEVEFVVEGYLLDLFDTNGVSM